MAKKPTLKQILMAKGFSPQDARAASELAKLASSVPNIIKDGITFKIKI
tara:strand:+ start:8596 stop:8742 length:147 start_codon:yes stop_codon:yes gene_type:complete